MRHVHTLGKSDPVLYKILPCLVNLMKDEYPQLLLAQELIHETLFTEEEKFSSLLKNGLKILDTEIQALNNNILPGNIVFKLYDTYGFPVDLTEDVLKEKKIVVDHKEFEKIVSEKKLQARASWKGIGSKGIDKIWYEIKEKFGATEFLGYNFEKSEGKILAIVINGQLVSSAKTDDEVMIVFNQTPFYAESGGQIGDKGIILFENNICEIFDTQKFFGDLFIHYGKVKSGTFKESNEITLIVDSDRRNKIKSYHSATHLLHAALRETLGKHVSQKGSYVGPDRLRFDFSHSQSLKKDELAKINQRVNDVISSGGLVQTKIMSPARAIELGAMALFGEKYGDEVRVVSMGKFNDKVFSVELCGGIHVNNLSEIGDFEVINETSIASGVRRVEALRGQELKKYKSLIENQLKEKEINQKQQIQDLENQIILLKSDPGKFSHLNDDERIVKLKEFFEKLQKNAILKDPKKNIIYDHNFDNFLVRFQSIHGLPAKDLREIVDNAKKEQKNLLIFVFSNSNDKLSLAVGVSGYCLEKYDASALAKRISVMLNGKGGGGRKDFAQAGGEVQSDLQDIFKNILKEIN